MSEEHPARVGVRELRQNLSVYLRRVEAGEELEVTEHGHPVARLAPLRSAHGSIYERLVAEGRITPAKGSPAGLPEPLRLPPDSVSPFEDLMCERAEDDR